MPAVVQLEPRAGSLPAGARARSIAVDLTDDWPNTSRVLPWALAGFLVILWVVPFDAIALPFSLPFEAKLDRVILAVVAVIWLASLAVGGDGSPRLRRTPMNIGMAAFFAAALASVLINSGTLVNLGEFSLAIKNLALLGSYMTFFFVASSVIRPTEVQAFITLTIGLACLTALGTIYEYRSDLNVFFSWTAQLLPGAIGVAPDTVGVDSIGRRAVSGPTGHGLAVTTMLALALPFAIDRVLQVKDLASKLAYGLAAAIILGGAAATVRKSAVVVPLAAITALVLYRPRDIRRMVPLGIALLVMIHVLSPGAMGSIRSQFSAGGSSAPVEGRTEDYNAVAPDLLHSVAIGRGYGSYDPHRYRYLDNQYLGLRITTGWVGVSAFVIMVLSVLALTRRRLPGALRSPPAVAAAAGAVGFAVASALFDVLAFPQVPYLFFFVAAIAVAASADPAEAGPRTAEP
jgi:polysaccharide biosynthesis protein PslJ